MVTYDDVTRPPLLIAEVSGAPVNLTLAVTGGGGDAPLKR